MAAVNQESRHPAFDRLPSPWDIDPSKLTTDAVNAAKEDLRREMRAVHDHIMLQVNALREDSISARHGREVDIPSKISTAIATLLDLTKERFSTIGERFNVVSEQFTSVQKQFVERDTRTEQTSRDSKVAVDAALSAAKEAVGAQNSANALSISKSEAAVTKQIDQIQVLIGATTKASDDKIEDIKTTIGRQDGRITTIESRGVGTSVARDDSNKNIIMLIAGFSLVVSILSALISSAHIWATPFAVGTH